MAAVGFGEETLPIRRIEVAETNCYLLQGDGGTVLIDPGPPGGAEKVIAGAENARIRPGDVRLVFVTHGHLDHYGAAAAIKVWCGAPVAAHPLSPEFSRDRRNALPPAQTLRGSVIRWFYLLFSSLAPFEPLQADLLLDGEADLSAYGVEARTLFLPGHSPDSLGIITSEGDVLVGDLFVNYTLPSQPIYLVDRAAWAQSCECIQKLAPGRVYVGHGEPFTGDRLSHIYPARYQMRWWVR
jgi:glyoxylase-like metal-dependent hydrolase (beta-lactamase superfamily II)